MFIYLKGDASEEQLQRVRDEALQNGFFDTHLSRGQQVIVVGCIGSVLHERKLELREYFLNLPGVTAAEIAKTPFRLTARGAHPEKFVVSLDGIHIGGKRLVVIAGPCAVESEAQIVESAEIVKAAGAKMLRGGAFKPRTSRFSFQGLGEQGLRYLDVARQQTGLPVVTEVISSEELELVARHADVLQIGARNMKNYYLLKAAGRLSKPILLKRGEAASINDLLLAAEYIVAEGNQRVVICLRGIIGFDGAYTRNFSDIDAIPVIKGLSHHPVIFDPSHSTGNRELVIPMALAAIAAGADGLLVEVHPNPDVALSDGPQSLYPNQFTDLMRLIKRIAHAVGRTV